MKYDFSEVFWQKRFLLTDSRLLNHPPSTIFFAIDGERHDGHDFIPALYEKGVRNFVVEKAVDWSEMPEATYKESSKTISVLQGLVASHRKKFAYPVIGLRAVMEKPL